MTTQADQTEFGAPTYLAPQCARWILGDIAVLDGGSHVQKYERAILVTFKNLDDYRAALKYMDPIFSGESSSDTGAKP